jgi:ligand-binding sensor domain-containing protein
VTRLLTTASLVGALLLGRAAALAAVHTASGEVRACVPLGDGQLVVGADGGLVLVAVDRKMQLLTALDGLPDTRVHALLVGDAGQIWVGTEGGLAEVRTSGGRPRVQRSWRSAPVRALLRRGRELWLATWGGGVQRLVDGALTAIPMTGNEAERLRVTALAEHRGVLVAATAGAGLWRLDASTMQPLAADLPSPLVWSLAVVDGQLLAGTLQGVAPVRRGAVATLTGADARSLAVGKELLLVGTFGEGLLRRQGRQRLTRDALAARHVHAVAATASGAACVAAHEGLFFRPTARATWQSVTLGGLPSGDISALAHDGQALWVGTFDRGLVVRQGRAWRTVHDARIDPQINALCVERPGARRRLWVATARGLNIVEGVAAAPRVRRLTVTDGLPADDIHSLAPRRGGGVLVGTARGLALIAADGGVTVVGRKQGLIISAVWAVAETGDGRLWLGTSKGLFGGRVGGRWKRYSVSGGHLGDDWVTALTVDKERLWVGTYNGGVSRFDVKAGSEPSVAVVAPGWVNFGGLLHDSEALWVATMDGLLRCGESAGSAALTCRTVDGAAPGRDVTAVAASPVGRWVASRRGLAGPD